MSSTVTASINWEQRAENIKKHVSLLDVMMDAGHLDGKEGDDFQMHCPFHGADKKASAHVYPDEAGGYFHCYTCQRHYDCIAYFAECGNLKVANAFYLIEKKYNVPKLQGFVYEKFAEEEKKVVTIDDEFRIIEQSLVRNKFKYGREKYSKMLFVLDDALKNNKPENMAKLRGKL